MIRNMTRQTVLSYRTFQAVSFGDRLRGMIGRPFEQIGIDAMVFPSCSSISAEHSRQGGNARNDEFNRRKGVKD